MVGGLIAVGGSCHDWQTLALEGMGATMFTQSVQVVDQMLSTRNGRPGNVLLRDEQIERAHKMGENIIKAINTPVEERGWLGDPDQGMCPRCHSALIYKGDKHWDGIEFPFECAVCGAGGDLERTPDGKWKFVIAANGLERDRTTEEGRGVHCDEIAETQGGFFMDPKKREEVAAKLPKYKELKFPELD